MSGTSAGRAGWLAPWPMMPAALALAVAGQVLVLVPAATLAGALLHLAALVLLALALRRGETGATRPGDDLSPGVTAALVLGVMLVALIFRRLQAGEIPWGLNNDEGIEGLIALRFLGGEPLAPFSSIGVARETLYHLLLMPLFLVFGPTISTLRMLSVLAGLGAVLFAYLAGRELFGSRRIGLFAAALLAVSPWHLLYSRTGLRNILLPLFLLATLWSFHRALRRHRPLDFAVTGLLLGLGMNSYTSFRVVPLGLLAWALLRRFVLKRPAMARREALALGVPFLILMIPQLLVALGDPVGFLTRGGYVLSQTPDASIPGNLFFSLVMPAIYPARFGVMQSRYFFSDGVSLVYAAVGRTPETVVSAALMSLGLVVTVWRFRRRREEGGGVLLLLFLLTVGAVGIAGPSLTRMIGVLPLLVLMAALFLEELAGVLHRFRPAVRAATLGGILVAAAGLGYDQYFLRAGRSEHAMFYYAAPQTIIGLYAVSQAVDHPLYVFTSEQPETMQFLTALRPQLIFLRHGTEGLEMEKLQAALGRQEFVLENHRKFLPLFQQLAEAFPYAAATTLTDARRPKSPPVAYILDVDPARKQGSPGASGAPAPPPEGSPPP